jgi:hypothetical protein
MPAGLHQWVLRARVERVLQLSIKGSYRSGNEQTNAVLSFVNNRLVWNWPLT